METSQRHLFWIKGREMSCCCCCCCCCCSCTDIQLSEGNSLVVAHREHSSDGHDGRHWFVIWHWTTGLSQSVLHRCGTVCHWQSYPVRALPSVTTFWQELITVLFSASDSFSRFLALYKFVCICICAFSALTLLVGWQEGHPTCKNWVVGCGHGYLSTARCRLAYGPADATATHCL